MLKLFDWNKFPKLIDMRNCFKIDNYGEKKIFICNKHQVINYIIKTVFELVVKIKIKCLDICRNCSNSIFYYINVFIIYLSISYR